MKKICILNGPNLNMLGEREIDVYGEQSFEDYFSDLRRRFSTVELEHYQSNLEGELINKLQSINNQVDGIILNAGGYSHTSVALADAVAAIQTAVVEVHISQPRARETERNFSLLAKSCVGSISGFGLSSYELGINYFLNLTPH